MGLATCTRDGTTPAHIAARFGFDACLRLLVDRVGASAVLTATDSQGWTAAHSAVRGGHVAVLELMVGWLGAEGIPPGATPAFERIAADYCQTEALHFLRLLWKQRPSSIEPVAVQMAVV